MQSLRGVISEAQSTVLPPIERASVSAFAASGRSTSTSDDVRDPRILASGRTAWLPHCGGSPPDGWRELQTPEPLAQRIPWFGVPSPDDGTFRGERIHPRRRRGPAIPYCSQR